jgi:hypothetical protein
MDGWKNIPPPQAADVELPPKPSAFTDPKIKSIINEAANIIHEAISSGTKDRRETNLVDEDKSTKTDIVLIKIKDYPGGFNYMSKIRRLKVKLSGDKRKEAGLDESIEVRIVYYFINAILDLSYKYFPGIFFPIKQGGINFEHDVVEKIFKTKHKSIESLEIVLTDLILDKWVFGNHTFEL